MLLFCWIKVKWNCHSQWILDSMIHENFQWIQFVAHSIIFNWWRLWNVSILIKLSLKISWSRTRRVVRTYITDSIYAVIRTYVSRIVTYFIVDHDQTFNLNNKLVWIINRIRWRFKTGHINSYTGTQVAGIWYWWHVSYTVTCSSII